MRRSGVRSGLFRSSSFLSLWIISFVAFSLLTSARSCWSSIFFSVMSTDETGWTAEGTPADLLLSKLSMFALWYWDVCFISEGIGCSAKLGGLIPISVDGKNGCTLSGVLPWNLDGKVTGAVCGWILLGFVSNHWFDCDAIGPNDGSWLYCSLLALSSWASNSECEFLSDSRVCLIFLLSFWSWR